MSSNISIDSTDSDIFYVEEISNEPSPQRNNSPDILNSTELSEHHATRMPSISTIASAQPYIFTFNDDSNEPTIPYGFGRQLPIVPPSLNDLNLPPNPFNILATMAIANTTAESNDVNYSPQSPEPLEPSPKSTSPINVSAFNSRRFTQRLTMMCNWATQSYLRTIILSTQTFIALCTDQFIFRIRSRYVST